jgi:hypothetical protein
MSSFLIIDTLKCTRFIEEGVPQNTSVLVEVLIKADTSQVRRIEDGIRQGETRILFGSAVLTTFTDRVELTLRQDQPGSGGLFHTVGSMVLKVNDFGIHTHQFGEDGGDFELGCRVMKNPES